MISKFSIMCYTRNRFLPTNIIIKPYNQLLNCVLIKFNFVNSFHNGKSKITLLPDSFQREKDIEGLRKAYESYGKTTSKIIPKLSREEFASFLNVSLSNSDEIMTNLYKNMRERNIPTHYLKQNIDFLKMHDVILEDYKLTNVLKSISSTPMLIETRLELLKSLTMKLTLRNIMRISRIAKMKINILEQSKLIEEPYLPLRIFSSLNAPKDILDSLPTPSLYMCWSLTELWLHLIKVLCKWKLEIPDNYTFPKFRSTIYISLENVVENIEILQNKIKFSNEKILKYISVVTCCPSNLRLYAEDTNSELFSLALKRPFILFRPYGESKKIQAMLRYVIGSNRPLDSYAMIFDMRSSKLYERLERLIRTTSLTDLRFTPNSSTLIYKIERCLNKFEQELPNENLCFPSVSYLEAPDCVIFNRKLVIFSFLKDVMNLSISKKELSMMNMIHYPELPCIKKNLVFLLNEGYGFEELKEAYQVLLFPHYLVVGNYNQLQSCPFAVEFKEKKDTKKLLQLLLYYASTQYKEVGGSN